MIKFFRKIRYKLMSENKTSRYFKYAIGEIVLVVIGILIALQINNWNEERKLKTERKNLINSIKDDLLADIIMIESLLDISIKDRQKLEQQSNFISSDTFTMDSLIAFTKTTNPFYNPFKGFNNNAYNSSKSSGKIEIIDEILKRKLFEHSILQQDIQSTLKEYQEIYVDYTIKLNERFPLKLAFSFIKAGEARDLMWSNVNEKDLALKLNSWGTSKGNLYRLMIGNLEDALESTKEVLSIIEKQKGND